MISISRSEELSLLYDEVITRNNILLHAASGMGKTHLLQNLTQKLEGRRVCFYVSLRGISSTAQLHRKLYNIVKSSVKRHTNVEFQLRSFFESHGLPDHSYPKIFSKWLEDLLVALQQVSQDFIFIIEDVDQYESDETIDSLFLHFRASRNSQVLFSAAQPLEYSKKTVHFELKPILPKQLQTDIIPDNQVEELLLYTAGNTAFILEILRAMSHYTLNFETAKEQLMESYQHTLHGFRHRFTALQWNLLKAIALEEIVVQPHSFQFLVKYELGAASSIERALRNLISSGIVTRTEEGYYIANIILLRWMQWLYRS